MDTRTAMKLIRACERLKRALASLEGVPGVTAEVADLERAFTSLRAKARAQYEAG